MRYYAHIAKDGRRQTVAEHCRAAARYAAESLTDAALSKAAYLAGLLHDQGKLTTAFQAYLESAAQGEPVRRGSVVHTFAGVRLLLEHYHGPGPDFSYDDITCELLAFAVGAHHGLFDCVDENHASGFLHRCRSHSSEYDETVENLEAQCAAQDEVAALFQASCAELTAVYEKIQNMLHPEFSQPSDLCFYVGMTARLLLSAVIQGDCRDTLEFMTGTVRPAPREDRRGLWRTCLRHMEQKLDAFPVQSQIQKARRSISEQCRQFADRPGGIYQLKVPTGGGKTLSSLRYALAHCARWNKARIIFTAPLLTILDQNAGVIRDFVGDDSIILEHHSDIVRPQETPEQIDERTLLAEDWHAPIIITTLVQLLNTLLDGNKASIRRFQALTNSVIILDEVQTVPAKMLTLFNLAVNFLSRVCGATVVLRSATQPCLSKTEHPLCAEPIDIVPYDREIWDAFRRTQIQSAGPMRLADVAAFARDILGEADSLLIVCNKKDEAMFLYKALAGCVPHCYHLSAAMCMDHRRKVLKELQAALWDLQTAPEKFKEKVICVSTQVIEAGVNISFERVIRLSAGMDSVIQSAGRCNRNGELDDSAPVYLVPCQDENLSKLPDIQRGKDATQHLLAQFSRNAEQFQNDLAGDAAVAYYYRTLYQEMPKGFQDYPIQGRAYSIFSLLADNGSLAGDRAEAYGTYFLTQAFHLAGRFFHVYEEDSLDVIVPYSEGKTVIADLGSAQAEHNLAYRRQCLERAKPYTISLYEHQRRRLERNGGLRPVRDGDDSVLVLSESFYDDETGLSMEGAPMQFLEV